MSDQYVVQEAHGPVAVLVLNRPAQRNALNRAMVSRLGDALTHLSVDTSTRAVVLTGTGSVFCAGMDLKEAVGVPTTVESEQAAIGRAVESAAPGDVVLIAGKGHEQGQESQGVTVPFDDRSVAREALRRLGARA